MIALSSGSTVCSVLHMWTLLSLLLGSSLLHRLPGFQGSLSSCSDWLAPGMSVSLSWLSSDLPPCEMSQACSDFSALYTYPSHLLWLFLCFGSLWFFPPYPCGTGTELKAAQVFYCLGGAVLRAMKNAAFLVAGAAVYLSLQVCGETDIPVVAVAIPTFPQNCHSMCKAA